MAARKSERPLRPDNATRSEEARDATVRSGADREPTPEEERLADSNAPDPEGAEHEREMAERGAAQRGEGRIA